MRVPRGDLVGHVGRASDRRGWRSRSGSRRPGCLRAGGRSGTRSGRGPSSARRRRRRTTDPAAPVARRAGGPTNRSTRPSPRARASAPGCQALPACTLRCPISRGRHAVDGDKGGAAGGVGSGRATSMGAAGLLATRTQAVGRPGWCSHVSQQLRLTEQQGPPDRSACAHIGEA